MPIKSCNENQIVKICKLQSYDLLDNANNDIICYWYPHDSPTSAYLEFQSVWMGVGAKLSSEPVILVLKKMLLVYFFYNLFC